VIDRCTKDPRKNRQNDSAKYVVVVFSLEGAKKPMLQGSRELTTDEDTVLVLLSRVVRDNDKG
jgi:hypothetical protein